MLSIAWRLPTDVPQVMDGIADQMIAALTGHELNTTQSIIATIVQRNVAMPTETVAIVP